MQAGEVAVWRRLFSLKCSVSSADGAVAGKGNNTGVLIIISLDLSSGSVWNINQVTVQWVRHHQHLANPHQQSHRQYALDLEHNLAKVVPALAPQGQARNLERMGPEERPPNKSSYELDTAVYVIPDSSESDMTVSENPKIAYISI
ncbi:hypothetical protein Tco_0690331 [Tanacetum coccineum]